MSPELIIEDALARYERPLISHARGITGDLESARDAVQDTFLRLSRQDVVSLAPRLAPWLFLVCRNCALAHARRGVRVREEPLEETEASSGAPDPAAEAGLREDVGRLRSLVSRLTPREQELVRLKFEAGLSYKEIGEVLRMSVSNVGVQLHNAIQSLRASWNREEVHP
ncbi:sigma-70 family RNA polymerase sigma factor [Sphaerospermopsis aphanizomenoides BCCUSP55]|nr:sigma-70 family RNA polymerase sigma factor [Sphaerospermopsis aphanizomenoides BCCUSP55]